MMNIGEKIKKLRKEKKLTLAKVAGDGLSVGMLSLIENGKAQPSMESLQHIASQLGVNVTELMQDGKHEEIRQLLNEMEQINHQSQSVYSEEQLNALFQQQLDSLQPFVDAGKLNGTSYEEIRLLEMYWNVQHALNVTDCTEPYKELIAKYEQLHAYTRIIYIYIRLAGFAFNKREYYQAIELLLQGKPYLEKHADLITELAQLDYYYNLMIMYSAVNEKDQAEHCLNTALDISKNKKIIYRLNDFYRYLFAHHAADGEGEKAFYYLTKIKALASILEDPLDKMYVEFLKLIYTNSIEKNYEKALTMDLTYQEELGEVFYDNIHHIIQAEHAYAFYYLSRYEEAIEALVNYKIPPYLNHPLDLARYYRTYAIKALAHFKLGDIENAKREILYAMDGVKDYEDLGDKRFIIEAYAQIIGGN